ncbi:hypothetical protein AKO1_014807 [Acrasis kona]|uniref:Glutamine amidotransferase domain-containing protein n=1 Tax=Acrasis kona TaxID=1008807 RepID=A0AAW2Z2D8_9EUKA
MTVQINEQQPKRHLKFCIWDPSNRTHYSGGEMIRTMYNSCSDQDYTISGDVYAVAYNHFPGTPAPKQVTLDEVDHYVEDTNQPNFKVTPYVPNEDLPSAEQVFDYIANNYDGLLIGGSDDSADDDSLPYIPLLVKVLRKVIEHDFPTMGYCIGGQLIARAAHGKKSIHTLEEVTGHHGGEYGFIKYHMTDVARKCPLFEGVKDGFVSTALHNDCFLVEEKEWLLTSALCPHAAFQVHEKKIFGFQFHLDFTKKEGEKFFDLEKMHEKDVKVIMDAEKPDLSTSRKIIRNWIRQYVVKE